MASNRRAEKTRQTVREIMRSGVSLAQRRRLVLTGEVRRTYGRRVNDRSNYLEPDRADTVRLSVNEARVLGKGALARIGYAEDDARIIVWTN